MDQIAGEHSQAAVFAAEGKTRHRLVRIAGAAAVALLVSWLIALALGVLGGFDSLPGLPDSPSTGSNNAGGIQPEASHPSPAPQPQPQPQMQRRHVASSVPTSTSTTAPVGDPPSRTRSKSSTPETTSKVRVSPSPPAPTGSATTNGRRLGTTKTTTGKPIGSPGNGPGGSGAPGRLR